MQYSTDQSQEFAAQALAFDGMTQEDAPSLGHLIGEVLAHAPTCRLSKEGDEFFIQAANGFVLANERSAFEAWVQAHQDYTPCFVLD